MSANHVKKNPPADGQSAGGVDVVKVLRNHRIKNQDKHHYRKMMCLRFALNALVTKKIEKINSFVRQRDYSLNALTDSDNFTLSDVNAHDDIIDSLVWAWACIVNSQYEI